MQLTSELARQDFLAKGKDKKHHQEIIKILGLNKYLSSWGISRQSNLTYHQAARRLKELQQKGIIEISHKGRDMDGSLRNQYKLV